MTEVKVLAEERHGHFVHRLRTRAWFVALREQQSVRASRQHCVKTREKWGHTLSKWCPVSEAEERRASGVLADRVKKDRRSSTVSQALSTRERRPDKRDTGA